MASRARELAALALPVADLAPWTILEIRHDPLHLIADLKAADGSESTVYFTAGTLAAPGRKSTPLYDGKPRPEGKP
jgi:hypothetical protein